MLLVLVTNSCRLGSNAALLQFIPPTFPGISSDPLIEGGVKIPSERNASIRLRHWRRSKNVTPNASSAETACGTIGGGNSGNGCVGDASSPGTSDLGTGFSVIGKIGSPVMRLKM